MLRRAALTILACLLAVLIASIAQAQRYTGNTYLGTDTLLVGSTGTLTTGVRHGTLSIATGDTSGTLTLAGVTSSSRILATINTGNSSSRTILRATPGSGTVQVVLSGTPGATTTIAVLAIN